LHLDGLADTADGLVASYDRERSLAVMRTGDTGPAGAAALVLTLAVQVGSLAALNQQPRGPLLAGVLVCVSRGAVLLTCQRGVPAARRDGLGVSYAGTVSPLAGVVGSTLLTAAATAGFLLVGEPWWRGPVCAAAATVAVAWLVRRAVRRLGGVTGDIYGAAIELSLAVLLLTAT
jgi:adenosylcobinamide-GDP ribazoletransferase